MKSACEPPTARPSTSVLPASRPNTTRGTSSASTPTSSRRRRLRDFRPECHGEFDGLFDVRCAPLCEGRLDLRLVTIEPKPGPVGLEELGVRRPKRAKRVVHAQGCDQQRLCCWRLHAV